MPTLAINPQSVPVAELSTRVHRMIERAIAPDEWAAFPDSIASNDPADRQEAERLVQRWEKLLNLKAGHTTAFVERLLSLGLNKNQAIDRLTPRGLPVAAQLPNWAVLLMQVLADPTTLDSPVPLAQLQTCTEVEITTHDLKLNNFPTFPDFLFPFIKHALIQIQQQVPEAWHKLEDTAIEQISRYLLFRLSRLASRTIAYEVKRRRFKGQLIGSTSEERYQYFTADVLGSSEGRLTLLEQYPVLGRLLATCTVQLIDFAVELLQRLMADWQALEATFNQAVSLEAVTNLLMGLSDAHCGGRTVVILHFTNGLKLVYKPRSFGVDVAFNGLLHWLNQTNTMPTLRPTQLLPREHYGWSEFIETSECNSPEEVAAFYQRQGAHTALFYFLCGLDFHCQNFIPAGAYPVPIDLEALLMTGSHLDAKPIRNLPLYLRTSVSTVLASTMSSYWRAGAYDRILFSASGINGVNDREWPVKYPLWEKLGTDEMRLVQSNVNFHFDHNLPRLAGKKIPATDYLTAVIQGLTTTYRTIMAHADWLLSEESPLNAFRHVWTRIVIRDTQEYGDLLFWSTAPDQLTSSAAYDVALEMLCSAVPICNNGTPLPSLLDAEKQCCWRQDIPLYYGSPSSRYLHAVDGSEHGPIVEETSFEQMQYRIRQASEVDLMWQAELLRVSLQMAFEPSGQVVCQDESPDPSTSTPSDQQSLNYKNILRQSGLLGHSSTPLTLVRPSPGLSTPQLTESEQRSRLLTHARAIGDALDRLALRHPCGNSWLTLWRVHQSSFAVNPIHPYPWAANGTAGTGLFLANLAAQTGEERYAELARGAMQFGLEMLHQCQEAGYDDEILVSGYNGLYMLIYALVESGRLLQDDTLIDQAFTQALQVTPNKIAKETNPDVLNGLAGALLALLHLYRFRPDSRLLEQATQMAEGIVRCQRSPVGEQGYWVTNFPQPLTGMGHGVAGMVYALLQLYQLTQQDWLKTSALAGLAYERQHYSQQLQEWLDLRVATDRPHFMLGWCGGAAGIGLARLGILGILDNETEIYVDIERAIAATQRHLGKLQHHACCGEVGRIAFLVAAAQRLHRADLQTLACSTGQQVIDFYEQVGYWKLQQFSERNIIPGLTDGIAGIGLMFLQLLNPTTTSQILLLS